MFSKGDVGKLQSNLIPFPVKEENGVLNSSILPNNQPDINIDTTNEDEYSKYLGFKKVEEEYHEDFKKEEVNMNSEDILKTYMDKIDRDQRELRSDMKEREERTERNIRDSEKRMDDRIAHIEKMIENQNINFDKKTDDISDKFDKAVSEIKSNKLQITIAVISFIIATAAIAVASLQVVQGFLTLVK